MWVELDVETTGRVPGRAEIIEVAAIAMDHSFEEVGHFESLVNPGEEALLRADPEALAVNRITPEMLKDAPPPDVVSERLNKFLDQYWGMTFHAFNNQFDREFLDKKPWFLGKRRWGECVMLAAMKEMDRKHALERFDNGKPKWPKLSEAAAFYRVPFGDGHRALHDGRVSAQVHVAILRGRREALAFRLVNDEAEHMIEQGM